MSHNKKHALAGAIAPKKAPEPKSVKLPAGAAANINAKREVMAQLNQQILELTGVALEALGYDGQYEFGGFEMREGALHVRIVPTVVAATS